MTEDIETTEETTEEPTTETTEETKVEVKATDIKVEEPESVVPDNYELTLPEESPLDSSIIDEIAATAKERGLSNEDAQTILTDRSNAVAGFIKEKEDYLDETHKGWLEETKNDSVLGGDNYKETGELTFRAGQFLGEDFVKLLTDTGLGNQITVVRAMRKLGEAMGDDKLILSKSKDGGGEKDVLDSFYDHPTSKPKEATG